MFLTGGLLVLFWTKKVNKHVCRLRCEYGPQANLFEILFQATAWIVESVFPNGEALWLIGESPNWNVVAEKDLKGKDVKLIQRLVKTDVHNMQGNFFSIGQSWVMKFKTDTKKNFTVP